MNRDRGCKRAAKRLACVTTGHGSDDCLGDDAPHAGRSGGHVRRRELAFVRLVLARAGHGRRTAGSRVQPGEGQLDGWVVRWRRVGMRLVCLGGAGAGDYAVPRVRVQRNREPGRLERGAGIAWRGVMRWCHEPAGAVLRREGVRGEALLDARASRIDRWWGRWGSTCRSSVVDCWGGSILPSAVANRWLFRGVWLLCAHLGHSRLYAALPKAAAIHYL